MIPKSRKTEKWFFRIWILILLIGISIILYPKIRNIWNDKRQSRVVEGYEQTVEKLDDSMREELLEKTKEYNEMLLRQNNPVPNDKNEEMYREVMNMETNGVIGYLEIPVIHVRMPIYHGTGDFAISNGAGHVEGSSFPIGGRGTHCVLSSHRGLPGAKLFSDLDKLKEGDIFSITVLRQKNVYKVDRIAIVNPEETQYLALEKEKDYCTLLTCTPYGINTKRLLVRGRRWDATKKAEPIRTGDNRNRMRSYVRLLYVILIVIAVSIGKRRRKNEFQGREYEK